MDFHYPDDHNYDCIQCGRSCQAGWDIPVEPEVEEKIRQLPLTLRVIQERGAAYVEKRNQIVLNMNPENPGCGYLGEDLLCGLHRHLGPEVKPTTCRLFPLIITSAPDGIHLGLSYSCSAVRQNQGRPLQQHQDWVNRMLTLKAASNHVAADGLVVHGPWFVDYKAYLRWESQLLNAAGIESAIEQALLSLALAIAQLPRPRTTSPKPLPPELLALGSQALSPSPTLAGLRLHLWQQVAQHLGPELTSVEARMRADYQGATRWLDSLNQSQLQTALGQPLPSPLQPQCQRYLRHLVQRKQLVLHPTILGNLCLLYFLPAFLSLYARALANWRSREIELDDYYDALDLAEKFLVYHCRSLRPLYPGAGRFLVQSLQGS